MSAPKESRLCDEEFGEDHDHDDAECARMLDEMCGAYDVDWVDMIPAGTPDAWIPDNPNEDGFCQSDFI